MAIFHVNFTTGSDANDGSAANPYESIKYALETNALGTGDTVKVAGSTVTAVDSACTYTQTDGITKLACSQDNTGSISVGDIIQIDSPYTQTNGWMHAYVTAIDASTITFYESMDLPGTLGAGNYTLSTFTMDTTFTSSEFETWTDANTGANVDIIGGYNTAFTAIVGRTNIRRSGLGSGSSSGTCFRAKYTNNNLSVANFENFGFFQIQKPINTEFGGSIYADNLLSYNGNGVQYNNFGNIWNKTPGNIANLYFINTSGNAGNANSYTSNFVAAGLDNRMNYGIYYGSKIFELNGANIVNLVGWNGGQVSLGAFGSAVSFYNAGEAIINGSVTINGIQNSNALYYKGQELFSAGNTQGSIKGKITAFNFLTGGATGADQCYYTWYGSTNNKSGPGIQDLTMPTGYVLTDEPIKSSNDINFRIDHQGIIRTDNYIWKQENGSWITLSDDFDTGSNAKLIFCGTNAAYATHEPYARVFGFVKQSTVPTSYTFRYKAPLGQISGEMYLDSSPLLNGIMNANFSTTSSYTDMTVTNTVTQTEWDTLVPDGFVPITLRLGGSDFKTLYIDSVTVTY